MPREIFGADYAFLPKSELLAFEEITRLAKIFATLGMEKIRLTGGEPLLRRDVEELVGMLRQQHPSLDLALTTNGSRLIDLAHPLQAAGLTRITVSLDALDEASFQRMNDVRFPANRVVHGIEAAVRAGFSPVKINCVVQRGVNEHAIEDLSRRFSDANYVVRFIEYMDVGNTNGWRLEDVVPASEIAARLDQIHSLSTLPPQHFGEVARRYRTAAGGEIGIIASVTQPFCKQCQRARLTADGRLFTCLFASTGMDLRTPLREGATDKEITDIISKVWTSRKDRYSELRTAQTTTSPKIEMSTIGG